MMQFQDYRSIFVSPKLWKKQISDNNDITWVSGDFISLATLLFVQQFIQENKKKKESHKAPLYWSACGKKSPVNCEKSLSCNTRIIGIHFCHNQFQKDKLCTIVTTIERTGISSYWQLYCLFNSAYRKMKKKSTLLILHEANPLVTNGLSSQRANKEKALMCNPRSTFASPTLCRIKQNFHHSDVTCALWASSSLATLLFVHQPVQKTTRLRTTDLLWGETTGDQWNLHTKGQQCEKCILNDNNIDML